MNTNQKLKKFIRKLILEALPLNIAKEYSKLYNKERYKDWFDGKHRIYIDIKNPDEENDIEPDSEIQNELDKAGYSIENYKHGLIRKKGDDKNIFKIGKVLNKIGKSNLVDKFSQDKRRDLSKTGNLMLAISRHPYDIAGMSTDRGWNSCMNLGSKTIVQKGGKQDKGAYSRHVPEEIKAGTLIAYLVNKKDPNIRNPKARVLMKPYQNRKTGKWRLFVDGVYGTDITNQPIANIMNKWLKEKQGKPKPGEYRIHRDIYQDKLGGYIDIEDLYDVDEFNKKYDLNISEDDYELLLTDKFINGTIANKDNKSEPPSISHLFATIGKAAAAGGAMDAFMEIYNDKRVSDKHKEEWLIKYGIEFASRLGNVNVVKNILESDFYKEQIGYEYREYFKSALRGGIQSKNKDIVKLIVDKYKYKSWRDEVEIALETSSSDIFEYLLKKSEIDVNRIIFNPDTLQNGYEKIKILLNNGWDLSDQNRVNRFLDVAFKKDDPKMYNLVMKYANNDLLRSDSFYIVAKAAIFNGKSKISNYILDNKLTTPDKDLARKAIRYDQFDLAEKMINEYPEIKFDYFDVIGIFWDISSNKELKFMLDNLDHDLNSEQIEKLRKMSVEQGISLSVIRDYEEEQNKKPKLKLSPDKEEKKTKQQKWWDSLNKEKQQKYLKAHPGSKLKITANESIKLKLGNIL